MRSSVRPARDQRAYEIAEPLRSLLDRNPILFPSKRQFRDFLKDYAPGAGFRNEFLTSLRRGEPLPYSQLQRYLAFLQSHQSEALFGLDSSFASSTLEELSHRYIRVSESDIRPMRGVDLLTLGPAAMAPALLENGNAVSNANRLCAADVPTAAQALAVAIGDAYSDEAYFKPAAEAAEQGLSILRLSRKNLEELLWNWRSHHCDSVWFRRHPTRPELSLLAMAMPLVETTYCGFLAGDLDEFDMCRQPAVDCSNRILLLTASGDARNSQVSRIELMVMVLNQLVRILQPLTLSETRIASPLHPGSLGKRAAQWGFRSTGNAMARFASDANHNIGQVETAELVLPSRLHPARNAALWGLIFLWQCFYAPLTE